MPFKSSGDKSKPCLSVRCFSIALSVSLYRSSLVGTSQNPAKICSAVDDEVRPSGRFLAKSRETKSARSADSSKSALYTSCSSRLPRRRSTSGSWTASAEVLAHQFRHFEHVDGRLPAEHGLEVVVGLDHPLVLLVLQAVLLDVRPEFLGDLGSWNRFGAYHVRELRARGH